MNLAEKDRGKPQSTIEDKMVADHITTPSRDQELTPTESRQAVTGQHVSIVLLVSLTLVVLAGLTFLASYTWSQLP
jgi:hypothetical protein